MVTTLSTNACFTEPRYWFRSRPYAQIHLHLHHACNLTIGRNQYLPQYFSKSQIFIIIIFVSFFPESVYKLKTKRTYDSFKWEFWRFRREKKTRAYTRGHLLNRFALVQTFARFSYVSDIRYALIQCRI